AGADLQAAIDAAQPGTTLALESGASWQGPFTMKNQGIALTTRTALPAPGSRVTMQQAAGFAKLRASGSEPALQNKAPINLWSCVGVEVIGHPTSNSSTIDLLETAIGTKFD